MSVRVCTCEDPKFVLNTLYGCLEMFANWFHQSTSFHFQSVGCFARMHSHTHAHMQNKLTHTFTHRCFSLSSWNLWNATRPETSATVSVSVYVNLVDTLSTPGCLAAWHGKAIRESPSCVVRYHLASPVRRVYCFAWIVDNGAMHWWSAS